MNMNQIREKVKTLLNKAGKKTIVTTCTVLVLGCAVILNVVLFNNKSDGNQGKDFAVDLNDTSTKISEQVQKDAVNEYFSAMALNRQQARDEAMDVLLAVAESGTALEEAKQTALGDINRLAADIENETNIETLVLSKGFTQCIAVINGENCNVIVESNGLLPTEIAQISEIVYEQSGIIPANLKIIEKNAVNIEA